MLVKVILSSESGHQHHIVLLETSSTSIIRIRKAEWSLSRSSCMYRALGPQHCSQAGKPIRLSILVIIGHNLVTLLRPGNHQNLRLTHGHKTF